MKKKCSKCKKVYPSGLHFYRDSQKIDGLSSSCKRCVRIQVVANSHKHRAKNRAYSNSYYAKNREKLKIRNNGYRRENVKKIFALLGSKCSICNFDNKIALQIDHIHGGGYNHRRTAGGSYYVDMLRDISKYRLLCANCNFIEGVKLNYRKSIWS